MYTGTKPANWAFHFVGKTLRNGDKIPADGEWLEVPRALMCHYGLHASYRVSDALQYAPGNTLCLVELDDIVESQNDKVVAKRRKILARFDATELLRADAQASALSVIHLWKAPAIVRQYLETGNESIRNAAAARSADAAAARSADARSADAAARSATARSADATARSADAAARSAYAAAAAAYATARSAAHVAAAAAAAYAYAKRKENSERLHNAVMAKFIEMGALSA